MCEIQGCKKGLYSDKPNDITVKSGDSPWKIAKDNKVCLDSIFQYNNLGEKPTLKIGQVLHLHPAGKCEHKQETPKAQSPQTPPSAKKVNPLRQADANKYASINNDLKDLKDKKYTDLTPKQKKEVFNSYKNFIKRVEGVREYISNDKGQFAIGHGHKVNMKKVKDKNGKTTMVPDEKYYKYNPKTKKFSLVPFEMPVFKTDKDGNLIDSKGRKINDKGYVLDKDGKPTKTRSSKVQIGGTKLSPIEMDLMLSIDMRKSEKEFNRLYPGALDKMEVGERVAMLDLVYNVGNVRTRKNSKEETVLTNFHKAMIKKDYGTAIKNMDWVGSPAMGGLIKRRISMLSLIGLNDKNAKAKIIELYHKASSEDKEVIRLMTGLSEAQLAKPKAK